MAKVQKLQAIAAAGSGLLPWAADLGNPIHSGEARIHKVLVQQYVKILPAADNSTPEAWQRPMRGCFGIIFVLLAMLYSSHGWLY